MQMRDEYDRQQFEPLKQRLLGLLRMLAEARLGGYSFAATGRHNRHDRIAHFPEPSTVDSLLTKEMLSTLSSAEHVTGAAKARGRWWRAPSCLSWKRSKR